jgi:putative flippase GtrA
MDNINRETTVSTGGDTRSMNSVVQKVRALILRLWSVHFFRYLVIGGINTLFQYGIFAILILVGTHYVLATLVAYTLSILFSFKAQGAITFKNNNNRLFFRFAGSSILIFLVNIGLLKVLRNFSINSLLAQAILTLPLAFASFMLMRKFTFRPNNKPKISAN